MKLRFQFSEFRSQCVEFRMSLFDFAVDFIETDFNSVLNLIEALFNRLSKVVKPFKQCLYRRFGYVLVHRQIY